MTPAGTDSADISDNTGNTGFIAVRWRLAGPCLPALARTVWMADLARRAVMRCAADLFGNHAIPPAISRHEADGAALRGRSCGAGPADVGVYFLPEDSDRDRRIDHLTVFLADGFDNRSLRALDRLRGLWSGRAGDWRVVQTWTVRRGECLDSLIQSGRHWRSVTPYFNPLHVKPRRGLTTECLVARQCAVRGLPAPSDLARLAWHDPAHPRVPPRHFLDDCKGRCPDRHGSYWRLTFPVRVHGPVALGFNRHYGLGLFVPEDQDRDQDKINPLADGAHHHDRD